MCWDEALQQLKAYSLIKIRNEKLIKIAFLFILLKSDSEH